MSVEDLRSAYPWPEQVPDVAASDHGWLSPETEKLLAHHVKGATLVVELGSWLGKSTRHILRSAPEATVVAVDMWDAGWWRDNHPKHAHMAERCQEKFFSSCWRWRNRIIPMKMDSRAALHALCELSMEPDVVFIDTSHELEHTREEIEVATRFFPLATVVGDDWTWCNDRGLPTVKLAVESMMKQDRGLRLTHKGSAWALERTFDGLLERFNSSAKKFIGGATFVDIALTEASLRFIVRCLNSRLGRGAKVAELGSGASTLAIGEWASRKGVEFRSMEHDDKWRGFMRSVLGQNVIDRNRFCLEVRPASLDALLVDHGPGLSTRVRDLRWITELMKPDGVIFFDDWRVGDAHAAELAHGLGALGRWNIVVLDHTKRTPHDKALAMVTLSEQ